MDLGMVRRLVLSGGLALAAALCLAGCGGSGETGDGGDGSAATGAETGHEGHDHAQEGGKTAEGLAALSEEDRAQAEKQKVCPISGQELGSMGAPFKVTLEGGKTVLLCCDGCEDKAKADPEGTLAKVDELVKKSGAETQ